MGIFGASKSVNFNWCEAHLEESRHSNVEWLSTLVLSHLISNFLLLGLSRNRPLNDVALLVIYKIQVGVNLSVSSLILKLNI